MSTALFIRRTALLAGMVFTVIATGQVQTATPTPAPPPDAAALSQQIPASAGASPIAPTIAPKPTEASAAEHGKITNTLATLPLSFELNRGQSAPDVRFLTRAPGYLLQLTATEMRLIVKGASEHPGGARMAQPPVHSTAETAKARPHAVKLTWLDANRNAEVVPESSLPGTVNYFKGSDSSMWHTNIPTFERVRYKEMYPGIDLVYYGNGRQLEYDLIVAPGADPTPARLTLEGAEVSLAGNGDLDLTLSDGRRLQLRALVAYQERDGERVMVEAHYRISRHGDTSEITFQLAVYDAERPLIIDPLVYSTFLGGNGQDRGWGIAVNAAGEAFVTGETYPAGIDFPTTAGAFSTVSTVINGGVEAFVTKLNATGSALVYSTFLGAGRGFGIAGTPAGEAFVTGVADGPLFPTTAGAFSTVANGSVTNGSEDAFVTKLNAAGNALVYSTFLGGRGDEVGWGIAVNAAGEAFVTGETQDNANAIGPLFPTTTGAFDTTYNGQTDAFVAKLNAAGSALIYSTFLGGSGFDDGYGIAVNAAGEAFVTGGTYHAGIDFPTTAGAFSTVHNGDYDAFVAKLNAAGSALVYSTFLGGRNYDEGRGIAVNAAGEAFVTGYTDEDLTNFPINFPTTAGAFSTVYNGTVHNGKSDAFVAKLNAAGSALIYSTLLGGSGWDEGRGIAVNAAGEAFVTGGTYHAGIDFPTTAGAFSTVNNGLWDAFVTRLNSTGSALLYSTFLGGGSIDGGYGIAVSAACEAFVTGETVHDVTDFPTTAGAFHTTHNGSDDAFVAKIATGPCCVAPPSGMVAWYPLDESVGATTIIDIAPPQSTSWINNSGTPKPGAVAPLGPPSSGPASVAGQVGGALYFNGITYAEVAPNSELDLSTGDFAVDAGVTAFTIDAWVTYAPGATFASISPIVDKFNSPGGPGFAFYIRNQRLELQINGSPPFVSIGPLMIPAPAGPWYHVAVTVQGGGRAPGHGFFYINGSPTAFAPPLGSSVNNSLPLWIGETRISGLRGGIVIDELEIFNRALSQPEIQSIVTARSAGKCKPLQVAPGPTPVVEFYNNLLDHFFITANPDERTAVNNGAAGLGWSMTGDSFNAGGAAQVCRFYGSLSPGPNSHFYTIDPAECQSLKNLQAATPATQKRWNFESNDFFSSMPTNGQCASGLVPVYRAYNNGFARGVDSNHRITATQAAYQAQLAKGWIGEGVVMCAPQ